MTNRPRASSMAVQRALGTTSLATIRGRPAPRGLTSTGTAPNGFGMVHPRAEAPWETLIYYDTEGEPYYTHSGPRSEKKEKARLPFPARLLVRLAWMGDRGIALSEQEVDRFCSRKPATILDVGCGPGDLLARCRDLGHTVCGIEPDSSPREAALAKGLDVQAGTCETLPEPIRARTFDIVIASHVLHHCIDPVAALRNVADRLVPGGRLICVVPNQECLGARWSGLAWAHLDIPRQVNVFTLRSLSRMIEQSSLRVEAVRWQQYCRQFVPKTLEAERRKYDFFKARGSGVRLSPGQADDAQPVRPARGPCLPGRTSNMMLCKSSLERLVPPGNPLKTGRVGPSPARDRPVTESRSLRASLMAVPRDPGTTSRATGAGNVPRFRSSGWTRDSVPSDPCVSNLPGLRSEAWTRGCYERCIEN